MIQKSAVSTRQSSEYQYRMNPEDEVFNGTQNVGILANPRTLSMRHFDYIAVLILLHRNISYTVTKTLKTSQFTIALFEVRKTGCSRLPLPPPASELLCTIKKFHFVAFFSYLHYRGETYYFRYFLSGRIIIYIKTSQYLFVIY